ncbi:MAG: aminotransferase class III-fold pyridoxal phosphate-dependent enzyme, partial [Arenicellales bacterium]|nr:aminotransferase class III-fold pyridoxal phosphate-dependent enzyme [Arenicellales bacterium]
MTTVEQAVLVSRDAAHLVHPLHNPSAHSGARVWVGGEGAYLVDADGNRFIDCLSGLWNNTAGNGRTELADAAAQQMRQMGFASGYIGSSNPRAIELAERLAAITYPDINHFYLT